MLRSISIGKRIVITLAIMVLFIAATVGGFLFNSAKIKEISIEKVDSLMLQDQKAKLKVATDAMAVALSKVIADSPSEQDRIELIRKALSDVRYEEDGSGYFFVFKGTLTIAHAAKPSLHGKDLDSLKDKNGVHMIRELSKTARAGGGFVEYIWAKPEAGDQPKLSYATLIPGTDYSIGTGVYIDNIEKEKALIAGEIDKVVSYNTLLIVGILALVLLGCILPLSILIVQSITKPIAAATNAAENIARVSMM